MVSNNNIHPEAFIPNKNWSQSEIFKSSSKYILERTFRNQNFYMRVATFNLLYSQICAFILIVPSIKIISMWFNQILSFNTLTKVVF